MIAEGALSDGGNERCEDGVGLYVFWPEAADCATPFDVRGCSGAEQADVHWLDDSRGALCLENITEALLEWLDPHAWDFDGWNHEAPMPWGPDFAGGLDYDGTPLDEKYRP